MPFRLALIAFTALTLGACFSKSDDDDDDDDWGDEDSGDSSSNGSGSGGQGGSGSGSGGGEGSGSGGEGSGGEGSGGEGSGSGSGSGGEGGGSGGEGSGGSSDGDSYTGPPAGTPIDGVLQSDVGGWTSAMTGDVVPCSDCTWGFEAALPDIDYPESLWTIQWQGGDDVTLYLGYSYAVTNGVIAAPGYIRWEGGGYSGYIRY